MTARGGGTSKGTFKSTSNPRPKLGDVAKRAGVAKATASRILRNDMTLNVRPETRARVMTSAAELDYRPNPAARGLRTAQTFSIGIIVPQLINPVYPQMIIGADRAVTERGYGLIIAQVKDLPDPAVYERMVHNNRVDGLLVATLQDEAKYLSVLKTLDVPAVLVNRKARGFANSVLCDEVAGARRATAYLVAKGHRRIAHLAGDPKRFNAQLRLEGYRQALEEAGIGFDPDLVAVSDYDQTGGERAMREILDRPGPRPTAIFVVTLVAAAGALAALHRAGIDVPGEISVLSFHDGSLADMLYPPLTTLAVPLETMGYDAAHGLIDIIEGRRRTIKLALSPGDIIERDSVAAFDRRSR